jgi:hypothetical protein
MALINNPFNGYDIVNNLSESSNDRTNLNNLGIAPIADDVNIFQNNGRNQSILTVTSSEISGNTIVFPANNNFVYTNGTMIKVSGVTYYVKQSNGLTEFKLSTNNALSNTVASPPTGDYIRSDEILFANMTNLVKSRKLTVENPILSLFVQPIQPTGQQSADELDSDESLLDIFRQARVIGSFPTLAQYLQAIDIGIDFYELKKATSILTNSNYSTDVTTIFNGVIVVLDDAGSNDTTVLASNPGVFILDSNTNEFSRIFSSNENVWTDDANNIIGATKEISMNNLIFDADVSIIDTSSSGIVNSVTSENITEFTHFRKALINNETYYICLKKN